jgi:hypothetical protein
VCGLAFAAFGLNGLLMSAFGEGFLPPPQELPEAAAAFFQALSDAGYMLPLIGGVQFVGGLMVLTGVLTPLGLVLLAPVVVNIVLYHHCIDPNGLAIAYAVLALELFLAYAYGPAFRGVLDPRARPRWSRGKPGPP